MASTSVKNIDVCHYNAFRLQSQKQLPKCPKRLVLIVVSWPTLHLTISKLGHAHLIWNTYLYNCTTLWSYFETFATFAASEGSRGSAVRFLTRAVSMSKGPWVGHLNPKLAPNAAPLVCVDVCEWFLVWSPNLDGTVVSPMNECVWTGERDKCCKAVERSEDLEDVKWIRDGDDNLSTRRWRCYPGSVLPFVYLCIVVFDCDSGS